MMSNKKNILNGTVETIRFRNNENGYIIMSVNNISFDDGQMLADSYFCVGYGNFEINDMVKITGEFVQHPIYGEQIRADFIEKILPSSGADVVRYLSSGIIKNIKQKRAQKIYDYFGEKTFDIIEQDWKRLAELKGISLDMARTIHESFIANNEQRYIIMGLQRLSIAPKTAYKIYEKYKQDSLRIIQENPYKLTEDIFGIGFKTADAIALELLIAPDSFKRVVAGINYALSQASALYGHVFLPRQRLVEDAAELLELEKTLIENCIAQLAIENHIKLEIINSTECIYLKKFYNAEIFVAKSLCSILTNAKEIEPISEADIEEIEKEKEIFLAQKQKEALVAAVEEGFLVITGGPGTGKTTTLNAIIGIMQKRGLEIKLAAPTGKAAKRMEIASGCEASTIHRLIAAGFGDDDFDDDVKVEADLIIIDECSMLDILLLRRLLKRISDGCRLIFVGDADQLPSVGPGNVLRDIINSKCFRTVYLNEIFRQSAESSIILNAHKINRGEEPILNIREKDFFFIAQDNMELVKDTILNLISTRLPNAYNADPLKDIQILCPQRKTIIGVGHLNEVLQAKLNPASPAKLEYIHGHTVFRENDRVMQIKNNYSNDEGVFNGEVGEILKIDLAKREAVILFDDDRQIDYKFSDFDGLNLAYAITIHKSQGSEYDIVIIPIHSGPPMLMNRNLLYTAITRAKKLVVLVGSRWMLRSMVNNTREDERFSNLEHRLKKASSLMIEQL